MSFVNRIAGWFGLGHKRVGQRSYFAGATAQKQYLEWAYSFMKADDAIKRDNKLLRSRARDLARNSAEIQQYRALLVANVLGPHGVKMQAQVRNNDQALNKRINDAIEAAFADWGKSATVDGRLSFLAAQQLLLQTVATDGEAFVRLVPGFDNRFGFALQLIDPDMVDHDYNLAPGTNQNEVRMGIEFNTWGAPVAYHVLTGYPGDGGRVERVRIPAREMIHLYRPERIGQTRGTTWFNSAMKDLRNLDAYTEAEILAARISASKVGWLKPDPEFFTPEADKSAVEINADPGGLGVLAPGYDFVDWSPDHPAQAFGTFLKACLRKIATGLRVSYNALANDLEGVNYSSMRSGLLIEREQWKILQTWWTEKFLQPVFEAWLSAALLSGGLRLDSRDPKKFNAVRWLPRGWAWVDPLKDVQAAVIAVQNGFASRTELIAEKGGDFEEILEQLSEEKRLVEQEGLALDPVELTIIPGQTVKDMEAA